MTDNEKNNDLMSLDLSYFTTDKSIIELPNSDISEKTKRRRKTTQVAEGEILGKRENVIPGANVQNINYADSYKETSNLIRNTIIQADTLASEIKSDIDSVRSSKTLKNKYTYLTNLTSSASSILSTKINAIRELNSSIYNAHRLELDRLKTLKVDDSKENDDMRMVDLYSAFINAPIGTYTAPIGPTIQDLTVGVNDSTSGINSIEMVSNDNNNSSLTPEQMRMRMESNPNIKTVVVFDQETGNRHFDVIDGSTGRSIPNYPRPDEFLLEDTTIDIHNGIAKNRNLNQVWPLVVTGSGSITEY